MGDTHKISTNHKPADIKHFYIAQMSNELHTSFAIWARTIEINIFLKFRFCKTTLSF